MKPAFTSDYRPYPRVPVPPGATWRETSCAWSRAFGSWPMKKRWSWYSSETRGCPSGTRQGGGSLLHGPKIIKTWSHSRTLHYLLLCSSLSLCLSHFATLCVCVCVFLSLSLSSAKCYLIAKDHYSLTILKYTFKKLDLWQLINWIYDS